jgi:hypothetical protein
MTLYGRQKDYWVRFDKKMTKFEHDLIKYEAPIPSSGCFLLIHLLSKLMSPGHTVNGDCNNPLLVQD